MYKHKTDKWKLCRVQDNILKSNFIFWKWKLHFSSDLPKYFCKQVMHFWQSHTAESANKTVNGNKIQNIAHQNDFINKISWNKYSTRPVTKAPFSYKHFDHVVRKGSKSQLHNNHREFTLMTYISYNKSHCQNTCTNFKRHCGSGNYTNSKVILIIDNTDNGNHIAKKTNKKPRQKYPDTRKASGWELLLFHCHSFSLETNNIFYIKPSNEEFVLVKHKHSESCTQKYLYIIMTSWLWNNIMHEVVY